MSASANDMTAYMQALLDPERMAQAGVLKAETALALREPLFSNTPELGAMLHGFFDLSATRGRRGFGHGGSLVFQKSTMEIYPEEGFAIFLSANTPAGGTLLDKLPDLLLDLFYPKAHPAPPRAKDAQAEAAKVAGVYRSLRVPTYRSEAPPVRYASEFRCERCQAATSWSQAIAATSRSATACSARSQTMSASPFTSSTGA